MSKTNGNWHRQEIPEKQRSLVGYKRPPVHTQFKPGQSGNAGGVKKGTTFISEAYKRMLALSPDELSVYKPKNAAAEIALRQIERALGNTKEDSLLAAKELTDRTEGKARQSINLNTEDERNERAPVATLARDVVLILERIRSRQSRQ